jgi:hypothetical protein
MTTKKIKNLLTGRVVTMAKLSKLISAGEYNALLAGETLHKWEHTKQGMKEIKLEAIA